MTTNVMGRPLSEWSFNYEDLAKITEKKVNTIQQSRRRSYGFDPGDLWSVVLWCARNAPADKKVELIKHATMISVEEEPKKKRKP